MKSTIIIALLFVVTFFVSCRSEGDVIDEHSFAGVYAHVLIMRSAATDSASTATQISEYLASRNLDREKMMAQLKTYEKDPERYRKVLQLIEDSLKAGKLGDRR
jgi:hypothetical protein